MLYRQLMSASLALLLLPLVSSVSEGRVRAASRVAGEHSLSQQKAKRLKPWRKKRVNQISKLDAPSAEAGTWGGEHIRLVIKDGGADIEYDCAHGRIEEPIVPDGAGRFEVKGTHTREAPGPIRVGLTRVAQPARYTGTIKGQTMTLTVTLAGQTEPLGSFTLTRGTEGRIRKCR